jgi:hypothetical protein
MERWTTKTYIDVGGLFVLGDHKPGILALCRVFLDLIGVVLVVSS